MGVLAGLFLFGPSAEAFIPLADRTMAAIARVNRASGRTQALQLELTMRVGERAPVAQGELVSHPSGLARLELRGYSGRIERYLLSGSELMATRDGESLETPRPLLQPFFLMQPDSGATLRAALETFGVVSDVIGLAPCGDEDCFVIGDPRLAAPYEPPPPSGMEPESVEDTLTDPLAEEAGAAELEGPSLDLPSRPRGIVPSYEARLPRLWVDTRELEVRRIDRAGGVFVIVGPTVSFERLKVPAWFEIHEPDLEPVRFEVDRAVQVNAPPKAFSRKWLMAPVESTSGAMPPTAPGNP